MLVRIQPLPPKFGGSRGRRWVLARLMTTRVRYPGPPPIISLKCYLVASAVWGRVVLVRIQVGRPVFALVSLVVEVLFCNQGVEVRFLPGAPSFVSVSKWKHVQSILRRYLDAKGKWVQLPPCGELQGSVKETTLVETQVISIVLEVRLGGR